MTRISITSAISIDTNFKFFPLTYYGGLIFARLLRAIIFAKSSAKNKQNDLEKISQNLGYNFYGQQFLAYFFDKFTILVIFSKIFFEKNFEDFSEIFSDEFLLVKNLTYNFCRASS